MAILGPALKRELAATLGLKAFRKQLRRQHRTVAKELVRLRRLFEYTSERLSRLRALEEEVRSLRAPLERLAAIHRTTATNPARDASLAVPTASQLRALRARLGDTRKAFAARLGVSPSIVFVWEAGKSTPRKKATLQSLARLMKEGASQPGDRSRRQLKISSRRRATLRLQGQYMS